jgi:acyl carrier protein
MSDSSAKLVRCFQAVFPGLPADRIAGASMDNLAEWDSVAMVKLLTVIAEEFALEIDWDNIDAMTSFQSIQDLLSADG